MTTSTQLSSGKVAAAFTVAVLADCIQLPVNVLMLTGVLAVPSKAFDIFVDMVTFGITATLLGFHWVLLPTAFAEAIPLLDAFPTWTGCVAFVVYQRKQEFARARGETVRVQSDSASSEREPVVRTKEPREPRLVTASVVRDVREG